MNLCSVCRPLWALPRWDSRGLVGRDSVNPSQGYSRGRSVVLSPRSKYCGVTRIHGPLSTFLCRPISSRREGDQVRVDEFSTEEA